MRLSSTTINALSVAGSRRSVGGGSPGPRRVMIAANNSRCPAQNPVASAIISRSKRGALLQALRLEQSLLSRVDQLLQPLRQLDLDGVSIALRSALARAGVVCCSAYTVYAGHLAQHLRPVSGSNSARGFPPPRRTASMRQRLGPPYSAGNIVDHCRHVRRYVAALAGPWSLRTYCSSVELTAISALLAGGCSPTLTG